MERSQTKRKAELRVKNSIHDRLQLETTYIFDLLPREKEERRRYAVDVYMYVPVSVGVNSDTYDRESFFKHLTSYFRIRTPLIQDWMEATPETFRLQAAERYFAVHLETDQRRRLGPRVVQELKLFGNFVHTRLKKLMKWFKRVPRQKGEALQVTLRTIKRRLAFITGLIRAFRKRYIVRLRTQPLLVENDVRRAFLLNDEYISYRLEHILIKLQQALRHVENEVALREKVDASLKTEAEYRLEHGMLSLEQAPAPAGGAHQSQRLETFTYRLGLLKKYISEVLFLKLKAAKRDKYYRNVAAAVGAGLAATFAGFAEHHRLKYLVGGDAGSGYRLAFLIGVAVIAYIFKDRIKDLSKEYLNDNLKHKLPDQRWMVSYPYVDFEGVQKGVELGVVEEFMRWLSESAVPPEVDYLRSIDKRSVTDPRRNEVVIHFGRRFDFELRPAGERNDFRYLKNAQRYDFSEFLAKLDNPAKTVHYYEPGHGSRVVHAPKVYHVNLVFRYETLFGGADEPIRRRVDFERVRVILDKNGIVRLETVVHGGELAYEEAA